MKVTRRMKRMTRKRLQITKMNLTSLMDVFTILVFFLLVNSGSPEVMEAPDGMELPESTVEAKPRETVVVHIDNDHVLVQGVAVAEVAAIARNEEGSMNGILARLAEIDDRVIGPATRQVAEAKEVTILADRTTPFDIVRRVMSTCTSHGYEKLSLAVIQKGGDTAHSTAVAMGR